MNQEEAGERKKILLCQEDCGTKWCADGHWAQLDWCPNLNRDFYHFCRILHRIAFIQKHGEHEPFKIFIDKKPKLRECLRL